MTPNPAKPMATCSTPASTMADSMASQEPPRVAIAPSTMTASPAAGPLTPSGEPLAPPTTMPPTMPAMIPAKSGAPEANAIPRQSGTATKNTTMLAGMSCLRCLNSSGMPERVRVIVLLC